MKTVKWTDNVCTVGGTCIHGFFTADDLDLLFQLCPEGFFTPTFYHERLPVGGFHNTKRIRELGIGDKEQGYYFTFMESEGYRLMQFLQERFPMRRGEPTYDPWNEWKPKEA